MTRAGTRASGLQDAASYDGVSETFGRLSDRFSAPLARRLVDAAQVRPSQRVLDVGTGTGVVALEAAARVGAEGSVLGIDISEEMLATARAKAARLPQADRVELRRADVQALDLADASFDAVVSLFAIHHLSDPAEALRHMHRVLRPGGRLAVAVGSGPPLVSAAALVRAAQRIGELWRRLRGRELAAPAFLERLTRQRLPGADAYHTTQHPQSVDLPGLVRAAGFTDVRTFWEGHATVLDSPEELWDIQRTYSTLVRERLARAAADEVRDLRDEVLKAGRRVQENGGRLRYRHAALFLTARRSAPSHV